MVDDISLAGCPVFGVHYMGPCRALHYGFDLHAGVCVPADERDRLERISRYALRPPVAQDRLAWTDDGQVRFELRRLWSDGTTHLLFDPVELLERLTALTPRPRIHLPLSGRPRTTGRVASARGPVRDREQPCRLGGQRLRRGALRRGDVSPRQQLPPDRADASESRARRAGVSPLWGRLKLIALIDDPACLASLNRQYTRRPPPHVDLALTSRCKPDILARTWTAGQ